MTQTDKLLARREAGVGIVTFNNPDRHNAVSLDMWQACTRILEQFAADDGVRVVVLTGAGGKAFVSGADISKFESERASQEADIERQVSHHIGVMPFLWLNVPGRADRGYLESNSITLLSCLTSGPDLPSASWLGRYAERAEIRGSGMWNAQHVSRYHEPALLHRLAQLVELQQ